MNGFIFDYSKCVGCHACMVACIVENGTKPPLSWRTVNHFNKEKLPLLGFVHQSIACNHCKEAPCMKACPSNAYSFDAETGAVIHNKELCIGCKYCTWACPFDAPKYNPKDGVIEKCHFCFHRLKEGQIPACALNCPTGALSFGEIEEKPQPESVGFSEKAIYPRIKILGADVLNSVPEVDPLASGFEPSDLKGIKVKRANEVVNPLHELPLALFTFLGTLIAGWLWSGLLPGSIELPLWIFMGLGTVAIALSTFHLGKPLRAYLSINNLKSSWLSREILFFGLFMLSGTVALFLHFTSILYLASAMGLIFLIAVEKVYSITLKKYRTPIHSANSLATALTFAALFAQSWSLLIVLLALKTMLFTIRTGTSNLNPKPIIAIAAFIRLVIGFLIPFGYLAFTEVSFNWVLASFILTGEIIDRIMYYGDFEPERPFK